MTAEIEEYRRQLSWILNQFISALSELTPAQLAWRPDSDGSNSPWVIGAHMVSAVRVYALGFGCGLPVERDREAEFNESGEDAEELVGRISHLASEIELALRDLGPEMLDEVLVPTKELWGEGEPQEISRRQALVESIRHAGIHLGELRLTRELALAHG